MKKLNHLINQVHFSSILLALILTGFTSCSNKEFGKSFLATSNIDEDYTHFYFGHGEKLYKYELREDKAKPSEEAYDARVVDEFNMGDHVEGSPVVVAGKNQGLLEYDDLIHIYMADSNGMIYRFMDNGSDNSFSKIWEFDAQSPITASIYHYNDKLNAIHPNLFFVGNTTGAFFCLNDNGFEIWRFNNESVAAIHSTATGDPIGLDGSSVYFGSDDGYIYSIDVYSGQERWKFYTGASVKSSPLLSKSDDKLLIVGSDNGKVFALDHQSGDVRWQFETEGPVRSSPAENDNHIYIGSDDGKLYALNISNGQKLWEYQTAGPVTSTPYQSWTDKPIYIGSDDGYVYALTTDGSLEWKRNLEAGPITSSLVGDPTRVYVNTPDGVAILDNSTGEFIDRVGIGDGGTGRSSTSLIEYVFNGKKHNRMSHSPNIHGTN